MSRHELEQWARQELDKLTVAEVALELHLARQELAKEQSESSTLYNKVIQLEREVQDATYKYETQECAVREANTRVIQLENYLNEKL